MNNTKNVALIGECMLELHGTAFGAMQQSYGGDTFNTAVYLARCGGAALNVHYATALGDDSLSAELLRRWAQDGLQLDLVRRIPGRLPGLYQIEVDDHGERRFTFQVSAWPSCRRPGVRGYSLWRILCANAVPAWYLTATTGRAIGPI